MRDYLSIGASPAEEDCVQVGVEGYAEKARAECKRFIEAIRQKLGAEPYAARLRIKWFPHDFGTYAEVVCEYYEEDAEATEYAFRCEAEAPRTWADTKPVEATA